MQRYQLETRVDSRPSQLNCSISVPSGIRTNLRNRRDAMIQKYSITNALKLITGMAAVNRFREYRPRENASWLPGPAAGAQPLPHNPRKQRKNPAAAGSGERFREGKWRSRRDSNPRDGSPSAPLAGACLRPLGHSSVAPFNEGLCEEQAERRGVLCLSSTHVCFLQNRLLSGKRVRAGRA